MGIEHRIERFDLSQFENDSDSRAALHLLMSDLSAGVEWLTLKDAILDESTKPLDSLTTKKLFQIRSVIHAVNREREIVGLSPVGPSGADSFLTATSSLKISHATGRNVDIVTDPTTQLALEAYRRRMRGNTDEINLGASHRCFRLQRYSMAGQEDYSSHFEMFGTLDTVSQAKRGKNFSIDKILNLVRFYSDLIGVLSPGFKFEVAIGNLDIAEELISDDDAYSAKENRRSAIESQLSRAGLPIRRIGAGDFNFERFYDSDDHIGISKQLRQIQVLTRIIMEQIPSVVVSIDLNRVDGLGHYKGLVFRIYDMNDVDIVDGGVVEWVSIISSNKKERTVVSGMGTELFAKLHM